MDSVEDYSCIKILEKTVHVTLPMSYAGKPMTGVKAFLENWKCRYVPQLDGVVVDYKDVSFVSSLGRIIYDQPCIHLEVKAKFSMFVPVAGSVLKGIVNRISREHVGCVVHNSINVSIHILENNDAIMSSVAIDNPVLFEVTSVEFHKKVIRVKGVITPECLDLTRKLYPVQNQQHSFFDSDEELANSQYTNSVLHPSEDMPSSSPKVSTVAKKKKKRSRNLIKDSDSQANCTDIAETEPDSTPLDKPRKKRKKSSAVNEEVDLVNSVITNLPEDILDNREASSAREPDDGVKEFSNKSKKKRKRKREEEESFNSSTDNAASFEPGTHKHHKKRSRND